MSLVSLPTYFPVKEQTFRLEGHVSVYESPLSRASQQVVRGGSRWHSDVILAPMRMEDAAPLLAFLSHVQAGGHTFILGDVESVTPRGLATGTPVMDGDAQTGSVIFTKGWGASLNGILKAGDFIQIGSELKRVVSDCDSDASGNALMNITPPLRETYPDGESILTTNTGAVMRLVDNDQASYTSAADGVVQVRFQAVEVF